MRKSTVSLAAIVVAALLSAPALAMQQAAPAGGAEPPKPAKDDPAGKPGAPGKPGEGAKDASAPAAAAEGAWMTDYEAALKRAKKEKKLILADFTGSDWCVWCQRLDKEVFSTPEFQKWAEKNVVLLQLDFPRQKELPKELKEQNEKLRKENHITGYPTILFFNAKGEKVGQSGYLEGGPEKWTKEADKLIKKGKSK